MSSKIAQGGYTLQVYIRYGEAFKVSYNNHLGKDNIRSGILHNTRSLNWLI